MSARLLSSHHLSPLLTSSELFSHLLNWSQLLSARLTSSQLFSAHSQIISALLWPKTCPKQGSRCQSKRPLRFPQRRFDTENLYTQQELVHTKAYTQRHASFNTETGKLVHRDTEAFTHNKLLHRASFYTQQTYACRSFCTQKLLHREALTQRRFYTQHAFTHRNFMKLLHREA